MVYSPFQTSLISACYCICETTHNSKMLLSSHSAVFQSILWKQSFLRAITGTISPQTGQFTLCCNDWTTSLVKCWYRRGIAHSSGKLQRVPRLFLDSFGWIPSPCSRCSLQRHNTDCHQLWLGSSIIGHSMGFVMLIQTTLNMKASELKGHQSTSSPETSLCRRDHEHITHRYGLSWLSAGHQIHSVSLKCLAVCDEHT